MAVIKRTARCKPIAVNIDNSYRIEDIIYHAAGEALLNAPHIMALWNVNTSPRQFIKAILMPPICMALAQRALPASQSDIVLRRRASLLPKVELHDYYTASILVQTIYQIIVSHCVNVRKMGQMPVLPYNIKEAFYLVLDPQHSNKPRVFTALHNLYNEIQLFCQVKIRNLGEDNLVYRSVARNNEDVYKIQDIVHHAAQEVIRMMPGVTSMLSDGLSTLDYINLKLMPALCRTLVERTFPTVQNPRELQYYQECLPNVELHDYDAVVVLHQNIFQSIRRNCKRLANSQYIRIPPARLRNQFCTQLVAQNLYGSDEFTLLEYIYNQIQLYLVQQDAGREEIDRDKEFVPSSLFPHRHYEVSECFLSELVQSSVKQAIVAIRRNNHIAINHDLHIVIEGQERTLLAVEDAIDYIFIPLVENLLALHTKLPVEQIKDALVPVDIVSMLKDIITYAVSSLAVYSPETQTVRFTLVGERSLWEQLHHSFEVISRLLTAVGPRARNYGLGVVPTQDKTVQLTALQGCIEESINIITAQITGENRPDTVGFVLTEGGDILTLKQALLVFHTIIREGLQRCYVSLAVDDISGQMRADVTSTIIDAFWSVFVVRESRVEDNRSGFSTVIFCPIRNVDIGREQVAQTREDLPREGAEVIMVDPEMIGVSVGSGDKTAERELLPEEAAAFAHAEVALITERDVDVESEVDASSEEGALTSMEARTFQQAALNWSEQPATAHTAQYSSVDDIPLEAQPVIVKKATVDLLEQPKARTIDTPHTSQASQYSSMSSTPLSCSSTTTEITSTQAQKFSNFNDAFAYYLECIRLQNEAQPTACLSLGRVQDTWVNRQRRNSDFHSDPGPNTDDTIPTAVSDQGFVLRHVRSAGNLHSSTTTESIQFKTV